MSESTPATEKTWSDIADYDQRLQQLVEENERYQALIAQQRQELDHLQAMLLAEKAQLARFEGSVGWLLVQKLQSWRASLLPPGSVRDQAFDDAIRALGILDLPGRGVEPIGPGREIEPDAVAAEISAACCRVGRRRQAERPSRCKKKTLDRHDPLPEVSGHRPKRAPDRALPERVSGVLPSVNENAPPTGSAAHLPIDLQRFSCRPRSAHHRWRR